jgi:hypothetical protein
VRRWTGPITLAALLLGAWLASALIAPPAPPRAERPAAGFDTGRAWRHIEALAVAPRPVGTAEHDRARSYVLAELARLGLELDTLTALAYVRSGAGVRGALTRNVAARLRGTASTGALLVMSHYDGVPLAPAAADAGLGTAVVLEAARALTAGAAPRNDVIFLLTDAEELGLLGARAFAAQHPWLNDVAFVLNFEARGSSGAALMFETGPGSGWAVRELGRVARRPVTGSLFPEVYARLPNDTDFSVFRARGLPGLNFAIAGSAQWYHTPGDRPEHLSAASLEHMGGNGLAVARRLAATDFGAVPAGELIYFHVPGIGLVSYGIGLALPLAVLLLAAFALVVVIAARRGHGGYDGYAGRGGHGGHGGNGGNGGNGGRGGPVRVLAGVATGVLAAVVTIAGAALLAHLLWSLVQFRHPELGGIVGRALHREWPYALAIVGLAAALGAGTFGLLRRWFALEPLVLGALALPVAAAVASAVLVPAGSYVLLWPSLLAVALVGLVAPSRRVARPGAVQPGEALRWAAVGGATLAILLLMVPLLYLVHQLLSVALAPLIGAVAAVLVLLLLPLLDLLGRPNRWWLPAAGAAAAALLVAVGLAGAGPTEGRPAPSNVLHVQDDDDDVAYWAVPGDHDDAFTARFVGDAADTVRLAEFSAWLRTGRYRVAPAPRWATESVATTVLADERVGTLRRLRLRLEWADPPMFVEVWPALDSRLLEPPEPGAAAAGSEAGGAAGGAARWRLVRAGLSEPLELVVEAPAGAPVTLFVTAVHQGLPGAADGRSAVRPPGLMAVPAYRWFGTLSDVRLVRQTIVF